MFEARILSLGEGGVFVEESKHLLVGSNLMLTFYLPLSDKEKYCMVSGKIVWINKNVAHGKLGCGVCFEKPNPSMTKLLHDYVAFKLYGDGPNSENGNKEPKDPTRGQLRG